MVFLRRLVLVLLLTVVVSLVALQVASGFFLTPVLEREGRRLFGVPVHMDAAGANIFTGVIWMKRVRVKNAPGFAEPQALFARTVAVDISLLSLLTSEFVIERILLKDPVITFEVNQEGELNMSPLAEHVTARLQQLVHGRRKFIQLVTRYELEKFSIRRGTVQLVDDRQEERDWTWGSITFSLTRVVYPHDPQEALPVAVYLNATVEGRKEGQMLVIGRFNPFAGKTSFDITGSMKDIVLAEYNYFLPEFPLSFADGLLEVKIKALCHDDQIDLDHQIRVGQLALAVKQEGPAKGVGTGRAQPLAFGLPPETVAHYFNQLWPKGEPFEFNFRVTGDLSQPTFSTVSAIKEEIQQAIYERITKKMNELVKATKEIAEGVILQIELPPPEPASNGPID
ncbi:MAG: hypothetical protein A3G87_10090 [Omnitrophica bacterium RIFCSPLOWO2_12_FULL_50_11]|nr:MAG: hypothetical protein A3G87_10090 [Omnitrophica bacterium RIFCSPLOWO2_12_FULL_50_11]